MSLFIDLPASARSEILPALEELIQNVATGAIALEQLDKTDVEKREAILRLTKGDRALLAFAVDVMLGELDERQSQDVQGALRTIWVALDPEETIRRHKEASDE